MKKVFSKIAAMFWHAETDVAQFVISASSLLLSTLLAVPGDTMTLPVYYIMGTLATEWVWMIAFFSYGILSLTLWAHHRVRSGYAYAFTSVFGCVLWSYSSVAILLGIYPITAALSAHIVLTFLSWWVLVRTDFTERDDT